MAKGHGSGHGLKDLDITRLLRNGKLSVRVRERFADAVLPALAMGKGGHEPRKAVASGSQKRQGNRFGRASF